MMVEPLLPLISCIVPVHNGEAFLADALHSIVTQSDVRLEVIVVDDGSTDDSARIATDFPAVRLFRQAQAGVAAARNAGLSMATGDFIAFLDADDVWLPGKLTAQYRALRENPQADYCLTLVRHISMAGMAASPLEEAPRLGRLMQCLMARRSVFQTVGPFDSGTQTRADQDWFLRAEERGLTSMVVNEVYTLRRLHGDNHSLRQADHVMDDFLTIAKRNLDRKRRQGMALRPVKTWSAS